MHHQITPINYQVITLHTVHANFNYDISTMDLHKKTQNNAPHNMRAPFIQYFTAWSIFKTPLKIKEIH